MTPSVTQEFLDNQQYSKAAILKYETVYGHNFISPGGEGVADQFISMLGLQPEMQVLDIGCGLGGPAFRMASTCKVRVHGLDLSENMIQMARERVAKTDLGDRVILKQADCLELSADAEYDAVHSRDAFLHIQDKQRLLRVIRQVLKPGGRLGFSDYCLGMTPPGLQFKAYVQKRNYTLHTIPEYANLLQQSGFIEIQYEDRTDLFITILEQELQNLNSSPLGSRDRAVLRQSWQEKLERAECGEQGWGWLFAQKP